MGCYINPKNQTKEEWLAENAIIVKDRKVTADDITEESLPVCLVDNGPFSAAAVAFSPNEIKAFQDPTDTRLKYWFIANIEDLRLVTYGLDDYMANY